MTCSPCRQAGKYNADAERLKDADPATSQVLQYAAHDAHGHCEYKTCSCQHRVGHYIGKRPL